MTDWSIESEFKSWADRTETERERRIANRSRVLSFGVVFLDRALGGIQPYDLILLGGKTGGGKTELVNIIAQKNVAAGKRVHVLALEAEQDEFERRMKYRILAEHYFSDQSRRYAQGRICYMDWLLGDLDGELTRYEEAADAQMAQYRNGFSFYKVGDCSIKDIERAILSVQSTTDLVILDHLHYIDSDDVNENRAQHEMVKKLRDLALEIGKPVIIVAHIRKGDRKSPSIIPDIEDFHGSSNIAKIATKAVLIAASERRSSDPGLWYTYMRAAKCRADNSRTRYVGLCRFDIRKNSYESGFSLGWYRDGSTEFEQIDPTLIPHWAARGGA